MPSRKKIHKRLFFLGVAKIALLSLVACGGGGSGNNQPENTTITIERAFPNLLFSSPLDLQHAGDGSNRLFVVERGGVIRSFVNDQAANTSTTYLDITGQLNLAGEGGLLGLAFDPNFASNGHLYVHYTPNGDRRVRISRFTATPPSAASVNSSSESIIIDVDYPTISPTILQVPWRSARSTAFSISPREMAVAAVILAVTDKIERTRSVRSCELMSAAALPAIPMLRYRTTRSLLTTPSQATPRALPRKFTPTAFVTRSA